MSKTKDFASKLKGFHSFSRDFRPGLQNHRFSFKTEGFSDDFLEIPFQIFKINGFLSKLEDFRILFFRSWAKLLFVLKNPLSIPEKPSIYPAKPSIYPEKPSIKGFKNAKPSRKPSIARKTLYHFLQKFCACSNKKWKNRRFIEGFLRCDRRFG